MKIRLYKTSNCRRPTILGLVLILVVIVIVGRLLMPLIYKTLYLNNSIISKTMVLEGWVPTYALQDVLKHYNDDGYDNLIVTGIPITQYEYASDFNYTSQATIAALKHFGFTDTIYEAANPTNIYKDRTYSTAILTKEVFENHPDWEKSFNIYSMGVHSNRTKVLFEKAFTDDYEIGIIAHSDRTFIGEEWWKSSIGFRNVSNEVLALSYTKLFFFPEENEYKKKIKKGKFFDKHQIDRKNKNFEFTDTLRSPFTNEEINNHSGFKYFDINEVYNIKSKFTIDTSHASFEMPTTTDRKPIYRIYGYLDFEIKDTLLNLTAYQNMGFKDHPEHGKYLFVPFTDFTNGKYTYGGGRFLDIIIPSEDSVYLDFNEAYNPYCAYSKRWSCPLVPFDNHLNNNIKAGEKKYK